MPGYLNVKFLPRRATVAPHEPFYTVLHHAKRYLIQGLGVLRAFLPPVDPVTSGRVAPTGVFCPRTSIATTHGSHRLQEQFTDIKDACALAQAIVDTVREPVLVLDKELRVIAASRILLCGIQSQS